MAQLPKYTFKRGTQVGSPDLSIARTYESISDTLFSFAQGIDQQMSKERYEQQKAQDKAILDNVEVLSIRSAYEDAALANDDYDQYNKLFEDNTTEILKTVPERLHSRALQKIEYQYARSAQGVVKKYYKKLNDDEITVKKENIKAYTSSINENINWYSSLQKDGVIVTGDEPESAMFLSDVAEDYLKIQNTLDELKNKNGLDDNQIDSIRKDETQTLLYNALRNQIVQEFDNDNADEFLLEMNRDPQKFLKENQILQLFPKDVIDIDDIDGMLDFANDFADQIQDREDNLQEKIDAAIAQNQEENYINNINKLSKGFPIDKTSLLQQYKNEEIDAKQYESLLVDSINSKFITDNPLIISEIEEMRFQDADNSVIKAYVIASDQITPDTKNRYIKELSKEKTIFNIEVNDSLKTANNIIKRDSFGNPINAKTAVEVLRFTNQIRDKERELQRMQMSDEERIQTFREWYGTAYNLAVTKGMQEQRDASEWNAIILGAKPENPDLGYYIKKIDELEKRKKNKTLDSDLADEQLLILKRDYEIMEGLINRKSRPPI